MLEKQNRYFRSFLIILVRKFFIRDRIYHSFISNCKMKCTTFLILRLKQEIILFGKLMRRFVLVEISR